MTMMMLAVLTMATVELIVLMGVSSLDDLRGNGRVCVSFCDDAVQPPWVRPALSEVNTK